VVKGFGFPPLPQFLRVSKVLVYQRASAQISGKKLVFFWLLLAALRPPWLKVFMFVSELCLLPWLSV
jgi:hypothetical protein